LPSEDTTPPVMKMYLVIQKKWSVGPAIRSPDDPIQEALLGPRHK
jgi:hypothetical protein